MTDLPPADVDPDDVPIESLEVRPLGEDGDTYVVIGSANVELAGQALAAWMRDVAGYDVDEAAEAVAALTPDPRPDWYWQDATEDDVYADLWLRALSPAVDGRPWGSDGTEPERTDEPLFRGVYFG